MRKLSIAEQLIYTTTKLATKKSGRVFSGTGFFYTMRFSDGDIPLLVTNRHVMLGADEIAITFHLTDPDGDHSRPNGQHEEWELELSPSAVIDHPNPLVDLCAIPIAQIFQLIRDKGKEVFVPTLSSKNLPSEVQWQQFDAIEDVIMIGCPRGLYDNVNKLPIARKGITATPLRNNYNGLEEFLIDIACFGGSSGSPVFSYHSGPDLDKEAKRFYSHRERALLVGVFYGGPMFKNDAQIIMDKETKFTVETSMHLGLVVRSSELLRLESEVLRRETALATE